MNRIFHHLPRLFPTALATVILSGLFLSGCFKEPESRQDNLMAIARWQDQRLAPQDSLLAMLTDKDAHVRLASVRAAGLIGRDDVLSQMSDALQDQSVTVRAEAAWSLGLMAAPRRRRGTRGRRCRSPTQSTPGGPGRAGPCPE